jgi:DNA polymerase III alpha subunit
MPDVIYPCGCRWEIVDPNYKSKEDFHAEPGDPIPLADVDIHNVSLECPIVWALMGEGITKGIFQLESNLGRRWSKDSKPKNLEDLGALNALLRPGCLRAMSGTPPKSMTERYVDRKHGREPVTNIHPALEPILRATFGVLAYQEQAMRIASMMASFTEQEADILRKAIGKKKADIMALVEKGFLEGCKKTGILNDELALEVFGWIRESQKYSFNKSHAVTYGKNAYWTAYCKAHFPIEFACSYIIGADWKSDKYEEIAVVVNDAKTLDMDVLLPEFFDIRPYAQIKDRKIRMGTQEIRDIGKSASTKLYKQIKETTELLGKEPKEWSWLEYLCFFAPFTNKTVNEALINCGALDYFKVSRRKMFFEYTQWNKNVKASEQEWVREKWASKKWTCLIDIIDDCSEPGKFQFQTDDDGVRKRVRISGGGASTKKRGEKLKDLLLVLKNPGQDLEDSMDFIAWSEEKYLGVSLSCSVVDGREEAINANTTCREFLGGQALDYMVVAVKIDKAHELVTKKGKDPGAKMARLTVSDSSCALDDVVCFPEPYKKYQAMLFEGNTVLIQGERTNQGSLSVKKVKEI